MVWWCFLHQQLQIFCDKQQVLSVTKIEKPWNQHIIYTHHTQPLLPFMNSHNKFCFDISGEGEKIIPSGQIQTSIRIANRQVVWILTGVNCPLPGL